MIGRKIKNKKKWIALGCTLFIYFLFTTGINLLIEFFLPYYLESNYQIQLTFSKVNTDGWKKIVFSDVNISSGKILVSTYQWKAESPKVEIEYNLGGFLFSGEKFIEEIKIDNISVENSIAQVYRLNSELIIRGDEKNELISFLIKGKYQGKIELAKVSNLSWQIDLINVQEVDLSDVWQLKGQLIDAEGGTVFISSEFMGNIFNIDLKINNLDLSQYLKNTNFVISNNKLNLDFLLKGNIENLQRFKGKDKFFLAKPLSSSFFAQIFKKHKDEKIIIHEVHGSYEDNIFVFDFNYTQDENNKINFNLRIDEENNLKGSVNGELLQLNSFFGGLLLPPKLKEIVGGVKFTAKISGEFNHPEIDFQMVDQGLKYKDTAIRLRLEAITNGLNIKVPIFQIESQHRIVSTSFETEIKKDKIVAKIIKFEAGQKSKEFRNIGEIAVELSKSGITVNEFVLQSKNTELKAILQILPNGEGIGKFFVKNLNIKQFVDFFDFKIPYDIDGQITTEIKFNCSLTDPEIQLVGSVDNLIINSVAGGNSKFDIQMDKNSIDINSFNLSNDAEKSKFSVNGFIPIQLDIKNGKFEEDVHHERVLNFYFQNTSTAFLRKIIPNVEALEGKISGELSSFKYEDTRYFLGNMAIKGGKIAFTSNLAPFTDVEGNFLFTKEKIEVSKVTGKMGEGNFAIKGALKLIDLKVESLDFSITGKKLKLINDDDLVVILSPTLTYTGTIDAPLLKGTLYAEYGNYTESLNKLSDKIETFKSASTEYGFWPRTAVDLKVRCDHNVNNSIKQTSFFLQGSANLEIKGFIANLYMSGLVTVEKGIIPVFSKEFIVEGGSVRFEENSSPYVNLVAKYRGKNIDVKMQVNQSLDDPIEPIYSSLPSYSEEEIQRYLILNMLPGQEGESFDFFSWIKTSIDYSDILSNDTLKWFKRFSFETRNRNRSGQEELGLSVEYKFDEPEWFSVKAIQDDNGVFNFFLVASKDFMGHYVDPSIFSAENFIHLDPKLIVEFTSELSNIEGISYPNRSNHEFDIQYLVKILNHIINIKDFHKYLPENLTKGNHEKLNSYYQLNESIDSEKSNKDIIKKTRKVNRGVIEIVFAKYFDEKKKKKVNTEEEDLLKSQIISKELKRHQRHSLQNLVKDELKSYVNTNEISYLDLASKKMERVCASWGYKDAMVKWDKIDNKYLDPEKTVAAVKFNIETGARYKFKAINFPDLTSDEAQQILKAIKFEPYKNSAPVYYSDNYINFLVNQTMEYFLQRGYLDVKISASKELIIEKDKKEISVNFIVNKKQLFRIGKFELYGNEVFSKSEIMDIVISDLKKSNIIEKDKFEDSYFHSVLLAKLRKHISEFYHQRGFYFVEVYDRIKSVYEFQDLIEFNSSFDISKFLVLIEKVKGAKSITEIFPNFLILKNSEEYYYYINQIISSSTLRWSFLQNYIKIDNWMDSEIKTLFNEVKKDRDGQQEQILIRKVLKELFDLPELNTKSKELDIVSGEIIKQTIVCQVKENRPYKFGKITFKPRYNDDFKTQIKLIKKNITVKEGEVYNIEKIRETVRKLSRLGVFQEVDYQETINNDIISIEFILRENKTLSIQVEGGYGEFERFQAGLRIFDHNIFGSNKSLGLRSLISTKSLLIEPVFDTPAFWGFRNEWVGFYEHSEKEDFILERIGIETNLHRSFLKNFGISFGYKFENTTAKDLVDELNQLDEGSVNYSGVQGSFSFINIDDLLIPHKGTFFKVKAEFNSKFLGSTFDFVKSEIQVTEHFPISERVTLSLGGRFGFMKSLNAGVEIPIQSKFFSGGGNTIRGYDHNSIGPQIDGKSIGGEVRGIFNTELRFPLTLRTTKQFGVVFLDTGFLEDSIHSIDHPEFYTSIGIGYRLLSPIGPIRLDLGLALKNQREDKSAVKLENESLEIQSLYINGYKARLHLSFGFAF